MEADEIPDAGPKVKKPKVIKIPHGLITEKETVETIDVDAVPIPNQALPAQNIKPELEALFTLESSNELSDKLSTLLYQI